MSVVAVEGFVNTDIRVDVTTLERIVGLSHGLDRKARIQLQKQKIYQHRNQLLAQQLETTIQQHDFSVTEYGKPYLTDFPQFHFNHSHSQKNYALAMSRQIHDLGVDIEDLDRQVRFQALADHAFHLNELTYWQDLNQDPVYWFKVWTTKEAVLKAAGLGVRLSLHELDTQLNPNHEGGMCSHPMIGTFVYRNFNLGHALLTVAWRAEQSDESLRSPEIEILF